MRDGAAECGRALAGGAARGAAARLGPAVPGLLPSPAIAVICVRLPALNGRPLEGRADPGRRCEEGGIGRIWRPSNADVGGPSVSGLASISCCSAARAGSSSGMSQGGMRTPPLRITLSLFSSSDSRRAVDGTMPSRARPLAGILISSTSFMPRRSGASCENSPPPTNSSQRVRDERLLSACSSRASEIFEIVCCTADGMPAGLPFKAAFSDVAVQSGSIGSRPLTA